VFFKRFYTVAEQYAILVKGLRTMPRLVSARMAGLVSAHLFERIMLAVTEVNGCEVCSYAHTRMALESGMTPEEIRMLLAGDTRAIPVDESLAIVFAQHYADSRGNPTRESWQRLVDEYGSAKSLGILGAARMMMIGNTLGIALSALLKRLKGRPVEKSSLGYEAAMILSVVPLFPAVLVHALVASVLRMPILGFPHG
jgi:AhpD family alkylhydroperoxidase